MIRCSESERIQDLLDGELPAGEVGALRLHLDGCPACAAEAAALRRLFTTLERAPLLKAPAALAGHVLARVLPSRRRQRRRLAALGLGYAGAVTACVALVAAWAAQPGRRELLEAASGALSRHLVGAGLFVLNALGGSAVRMADGWGLLQDFGQRLSPLARALGAVLQQPGISLTLWAAAAVCALLLWWMRPRPRPAVREVRHVGVLGF